MQFRNIKVTDPAGNTLFDGLPPRNALAARPAYWGFFGNATFSNESSELVPMTCPAVWLQAVSAERPRPRWASCLILFDHKTCYGAPAWVVEKLWRDHFAPKRLKLDGPDQPLNSVATLSEDGKTLHLKSVNPTKQPVTISLTTSAAFATAQAELLVVSGRESDRNSLAEPVQLAPRPQPVVREAGVIHFAMPALSAGVLTLSTN